MTSFAIERKLIAFYVDMARAKARTVASAVAAHFRERGFAIAVWDGQDELGIATAGARVDGAGLIITVGGDGTLLRAARTATGNGIPILGINAGRLGFLTELDEDDARIASLPELVEAGVVIEERVAFAVEHASQTYFALNDVVVRKGDVSRIVPFGLSLDNEMIAKIPADGICVATPTGSTAYFLSAGGPIISPVVEAFGIVPLLPHTLFSRPLIVPASSRIEITCDSEIARAHLECDGDVHAELAAGAIVSIRRHPKPLRFARLEPLRFFERLEEKMRWGVSIRATSR